MNRCRRRTLLICAGAPLLAPLARAQTAGRTYRIGILWLADVTTAGPFHEGFLAGLREQGFEPGRNLVVDARYCDGDVSRLPAYVDELIALKPDLLAGNDHVAQAMQRRTAVIPILLTLSNDPVATGLVKSLARPGTNVTGMAVLGPSLGAKITELMAEFLPRMKRIAILVLPDAPASGEIANGVRAAALAKGVQVIAYEVKDQASLEQAFAEMEHSRPEALLGTGGTPVLVGLRRLIAENALRLRIAAAGAVATQAEAGFLFSYGVKLQDVLRRAASQASRILAGTRPADLPVEQASTFEFVVNLRTARALGITVSPTLRLRVDRFVE